MNLPTGIPERLARLGYSVDDVDERFIRGSGPGGQKINKTSSTVWLRHRPTGLEVRVQDERSQASNRFRAWEELCARLERRQLEAEGAARSLREKERRRRRQKSRGQKARMVDSKRRHSSLKSNRGRVGPE